MKARSRLKQTRKVAHNRGKKYMKNVGYYKPYERWVAPVLLVVSLIASAYSMSKYEPKVDQVQAEVVVARVESDNAGQVTASATPEPTPTPAPKLVADTTEKQEIIAYIVEVFGEDAPDAFNILHCENKGLNPRAINHNRNGSVDRGIFQLNSQYWGGEENFDWKINIDKAYMIFKRADYKWTPWSCSHRVNQKNYLGE